MNLFRIGQARSAEFLDDQTHSNPVGQHVIRMIMNPPRTTSTPHQPPLSATNDADAMDRLALALEQGRSRLGLRLKLSHAQRDELVADGTGDKLDAVLCLVQAAWASQQPRSGLPKELDALEGWITSA